VVNDSCGGCWAIDCERIPFPVVQLGTTAHLTYHSSRRVCGCPGHDDALKVVSLVPIATLLDEQRLSSMAAHPSAAADWYWRSPEPIDNPVFDEEFPEEGDEF
jgi:hypothetical protein